MIVTVIYFCWFGFIDIYSPPPPPVSSEERRTMAKRHAAIIGDTLLNLDHKSLSVLKREFDKKTRENARAYRVRKGSKDKKRVGSDL